MKYLFGEHLGINQLVDWNHESNEVVTVVIISVVTVSLGDYGIYDFGDDIAISVCFKGAVSNNEKFNFIRIFACPCICLIASESHTQDTKNLAYVKFFSQELSFEIDAVPD